MQPRPEGNSVPEDTDVSRKLDAWEAQGRIFSLHDGRSRRYPLFQFREGRPLADMAPILASMRSRDFSDREIAIWFDTPNADLGDWNTPADTMARDPGEVAKAAAAKAVEIVY